MYLVFINLYFTMRLTKATLLFFNQTYITPTHAIFIRSTHLNLAIPTRQNVLDPYLKLKMDGEWRGSFPEMAFWPIFRCELLISGSVFQITTPNPYESSNIFSDDDD